MEWLNEPGEWTQADGGLTVTPDAGSDFWRLTHYGFIHDNGHAWLEPVAGDFTASVSFTADYRAQYDQAGLMVRVDAENWLKTGIEFVDGSCLLSAVVTRGHSDWSVAPLDQCPGEVWLRVVKTGESYDILASLDGSEFKTIRVTHLPGDSVSVGPTACAPTDAGFIARFHDFRVMRS